MHLYICNYNLSGVTTYGPWLYAMGHWDDSAALVWEVDAHKMGNDTYFTFKKLKEPSLVSVVDLDDWEAVAVKSRFSDMFLVDVWVSK